MRAKFRLVAVSILTVLGAFSNCVQRASAKSENVELHLLLPSGEPAANLAANIQSTDRHPFPNDPMPHANVTTDAQGVARFNWGIEGIDVTIPDVGYGMTGAVQIVPDHVVKLFLPALAPFAIVHGTVPKSVLDNDLRIVTQLYFGEDGPSTTADNEGNFTIKVRGEEIYLRANSNKKVVAKTPNSIVLVPGQVVNGLKLLALTEDEQREWNSGRAIMPQRPAAAKAPWATGTVRDEKGKPIAGVKVSASGTYDGGNRMYEVAASAETDGAGNYTVIGEAGLQDFSATLVASKPGFAPGIDWITLPSPPYAEIPGAATEPTTRFVSPQPPRCDFVLGPHGGSLDVAIVSEGKPANGVTVELRRDGGSLREIWAAGTNDPAQAEAEKVAYPTALTGVDGVAHFKDLFPGRYEITASENPPDESGNGYHPVIGSDHRPRNEAIGVCVRAAELTQLKLSIYPQFNQIKLQAFRDARKPLSGEQIAFEYGRVNGGGWNTRISTDNTGLGAMNVDSVGLWQAIVKYRDDESAVAATFGEYYFAARGFVAVSPLLAEAAPAKFTAVPVHPGGIEVELQDIQGNPTRGVVCVGLSCDPAVAGSTDAKGHIRFDGLSSFKWEVHAALPGAELPDLGGGYSGIEQGPLPDNRELVNRTFIPAPEVSTVPNHDVHLTLRPRLGGYIRGTLHPPKGHATTEYSVSLRGLPWQGASMNYHNATGEFCIGPFEGGKAELQAFPSDRSGDVLALQDVVIEPGKVVHRDITVTAAPTTDRMDKGSVSMTMSGIQQRGSIGQYSGKVFLHDGVTPAYGAELYYFGADSNVAGAGGTTDAVGVIHARERWAFGQVSDAAMPGSARDAVLIALLPGATGAQVIGVPQPLAKDLKIVLPPAIHVHGQVKIGGEFPGKAPGQLRVLAEYLGNPRLAEVLSVITTPQPDGSFDLIGLTPGDYHVQASLDGIWLSSMVELRVAPDTPSSVNLEIPFPGGALIVKVLDEKGKPVIGHQVTVDQPNGPLTQLLWPAEFITDGAGEAYFPALASGDQIVRLVNDPEPHHVSIAPSSVRSSLTVELKLPSGHS